MWVFFLCGLRISLIRLDSIFHRIVDCFYAGLVFCGLDISCWTWLDSILWKRVKGTILNLNRLEWYNSHIAIRLILVGGVFNVNSYLMYQHLVIECLQATWIYYNIGEKLVCLLIWGSSNDH